MGKTCKVVVCGQAAVGKTALLEQLIYGNHLVGAPMFSTIEDIYVAHIDTDRGQREKVRFYDTAGLDSARPDLPRQYLSFADGIVLVYDLTSIDSFFCVEALKKQIDKCRDKNKEGFVLVYDVTNYESFSCMDKLKREIDKYREKKEAVIISLGNKCDLKEGKQVDFNAANKWAQREKVRLWEVSVVNRQSLIEPFMWLTSRMTLPPNRSTFPIPGMGKKNKSASDS